MKKRNLQDVSRRYEGALDYLRKPHYWRRLRLWISLAVVAAVAAGIALYSMTGSEQFYSTGPVTRTHASLDCAACHDPRDASAWPAGITPAAVGAHNVAVLDSVNQHCRQCHALEVTAQAKLGAGNEVRTISFQHVPAVPEAEDLACIACHKEHEGPGRMEGPALATCASCHDDPLKMKALLSNSQSLRQAHPELFAAAAGGEVVSFHTKSPASPKAFASFAGHPEFRPLQPGEVDPTNLKFGHERHQKVWGRELDCASCHQPDASGAYFQSITYEKNCAECHAIQFDPSVPDLTIPHGRPEQVRQFIYALRSQYESYYRSVKNLPEEQVGPAATRALNDLARTYDRTGRELVQALEQTIFLKTPRSAMAGLPDGDPQPADDERKIGYWGCVTCHDVKESSTPGAVPEVTKPRIVERWLPHGQFDHSKHRVVAAADGTVRDISCIECHRAEDQKAGADWIATNSTEAILLPSQQSCTECHRPEGVASDSCYECHQYHASSAKLRLTSPDSFAPLLAAP